MKITIWQQFSSNHSASYTVAGKFKTAEKATYAGEILNLIAHEIKDTVPQPYIAPDGNEGFTPTQKERDIGAKYDIEWEHGVDWAQWRSTWTYGNPAKVFRDIVWFDIPHPYSWQGPQPIDQIMKKLGAESVVVDAEVCVGIPSYPDSTFIFDLSFEAPNENYAKVIYEDFKIDFEVKRDDLKSKDHELRASLRDDSLTDLPFAYRLIEDELMDPNERVYEVEREGKTIRLIGLDLWQDPLEVAFREIIDYLEQRDCTNIDYVFRTVRFKPYKPE